MKSRWIVEFLNQTRGASQKFKTNFARLTTMPTLSQHCGVVAKLREYFKTIYTRNTYFAFKL